LFEVILCALELRPQLIDFGLTLLDVKSTTGIGAQELRHLGEPQFLKFQLRIESVDLSLERRWIDFEQHIVGFDRLIRLDGDVDDLSRSIWHNLN
jgi:hypothetical protein